MKIKNVNTFTRACLASVFALSLFGCGGADTTTETFVVPVNTTEPVSDWNLVWADEFEGDTLDSGNWNYEVNCLGGGNAERQCYTENPENLFLADGNLNIVALPASGQEQPYSSARINSAGKADFKYGRIEMRAKLPEGQGSWPAFWMMPTDSVYGQWPRSGEIDIMEAVNLKTVDPRDGSDQRSVYGTLHYGEAFPNNDSSGMEFIFPAGTNPADDFHTYSIEWQEGEIRWYVDNYLYAVQTRSELSVSAGGDVLGLSHKGWYSEYIERGTGVLKKFWDNSPFDEDFHLILNLAVGGNWPENVNDLGIDADAFTEGQAMVVDYVRVYQCALDPDTGKGCETLRPGFDVINDAGQVVGFEPTTPAYREGAAPPPPLPNVGGGETIAVFENGVAGDWAINACCDGNSTSELVADGTEQVVQFNITGDAAVVGFDLRAAGESINLIPLAGDGVLQFDIRVLSQPTSPDAEWLVKVESDGECCVNFGELELADLPEGAPVVGEWKTYTIAVSDLIADGLEPSLVDAVFIFPGFTTGAGAVVQINNVSFVSASSVPTLEVFSGVETAPWAINACCDGNSVSQIVTEGDGNEVVEFTITGDQSVVGFDSRAAGEQFNLIPYNGTGSIKFDIKVISQPTSGSPWLLKVESDGQCCADFAEIPLASLPEGAPVVGEWKSYSVPVADLIADGLEPTLVDAIFIFPGFTTGAGAVVQFDNVRFEASADAGGGGDGGDNGGDGGDSGTPPVIFAIGQEILSNGSFDTNADGWTGGMVMPDGDNNVLMNAVSAAGDPWSVNTSQITTIEPSTNYTLTFRARASEARSIIAGIGLNAAPFSSDTENVALTTEWQTFTLELTSLDENGDPFGDDNSRALFDMGAEVGDVFLDDISLVKSAQLVVNGGFDFDNKEWNATPENIIDEAGNKVYFVNVTEAGDSFAVNLSQVMTLEPSEAYTVTFKAKASVSRTMLVGLGLNAAPFSASTEEVTLGTEWETYTYTIETITAEDVPVAFGDSNSRVLFDMGADVGEVYIDDVTVELVVPEGPAAGEELVTNGSFESGPEGWINAIGADNVIDDNGDQVYFVDVTAAGQPFNVNISQVMTLVPSADYTVSFRAKSNLERTILAGLGLNAQPFYAATESAALNTEWQAFTFTITTISDGDAIPFGDDNSRVLFDMGAEVGEVYIDDVSVIRQ